MNVCDYPGCSKAFPKYWRLKEHKCSAHGEKRSFLCEHPNCGKAFIRAYHLKRHALSHKERTFQFKCSFQGCGKEYKSKQSLSKHEKTHSDPLPYKCPEEGCSESFKKHSHLAMHVTRHSHDLKPLKCTHPGCEAAYKWPSELKKHQKKHKGYDCSYDNCTVHCDTWSAMRRHLATHPKMCEECGATFTTSGQLKLHSESHLKVRPMYSCQWEGCSRAYTTMYNLKQHVSSFHEQKQLFSCTQESCSAHFSTKQALQRHLASVHGGKREKTSKPKKNGRKRTLASRLSGYVQRKGEKRPRMAPGAELTATTADGGEPTRVAAAVGAASAGGDVGITGDAGEEEGRRVCQPDELLCRPLSAPTNTKPDHRSRTLLVVSPSSQTPIPAASSSWALTGRGTCAGESQWNAHCPYPEAISDLAA